MVSVCGTVIQLMFAIMQLFTIRWRDMRSSSLAFSYSDDSFVVVVDLIADVT
jgi:hypothetical protein